MDFYDVIEKRRTIRDFENETISEEVVERIISAGLKAPTNDHMRDWHYIAIQNKDIVANLLEIIPKGISDNDMEQLLKDWNLKVLNSRKHTGMLFQNNIECCLMLQ